MNLRFSALRAFHIDTGVGDALAVFFSQRIVVRGVALEDVGPKKLEILTTRSRDSVRAPSAYRRRLNLADLRNSRSAAQLVDDV